MKEKKYFKRIVAIAMSVVLVASAWGIEVFASDIAWAYESEGAQTCPNHLPSNDYTCVILPSDVVLSNGQTFTPERHHAVRSFCQGGCGSFSDYYVVHTFDSNGRCTGCNYQRTSNSQDVGGSGGSGGNAGGTGGSSSRVVDNGGGSGGGGGSTGESQKGKGSNDASKKKIAKIPTAKDLTYNGNEQKGVKAGTGYTVSKNKATNAGKYKAVAKLKSGYKWTDGSTANKTIKWEIKKAKNPGSVKFKKNPSIKYSKVKKSKQTIKAKNLFKVKNAKGEVSYSMSKAVNYIGVNKKTGDLVIKQGLPKGTYTVQVKVTASGDKNYKKGEKVVTLKLKVK